MVHPNPFHFHLFVGSLGVEFQPGWTGKRKKEDRSVHDPPAFTVMTFGNSIMAFAGPILLSPSQVSTKAAKVSIELI